MRREIKNVILRNLIYYLAGAMAVWHVLLATLVLVDTIYIVSVDLMIAMVLIFLLYPAGKWAPRQRPSCVDVVLSVAAVAVGVYTIVQYPSYMYRMGFPTNYDIIVGCIAIALSLEAARRTIGPVLPIIAALSIMYCFLGEYVPGDFASKRLSLGRVIFHLFCGLEGIYGVMLIVMGTVIFLFVLFAAFVRNSATSRFIMDISYSIVGKAVGGPAKLAVGVSGFMGMLTSILIIIVNA